MLRTCCILICLTIFSFSLQAQENKNEHPIITLMHNSAQDWNNGDLGKFMSVYDLSATFMTSKGPAPYDSIRPIYQRVFFVGDKPKQQLSYSELVVRPLGKDHAMLTGKFTLTGGGMKDLTGRYTVMFMKKDGKWLIIHDHS